jgi:hypothetical protein
MPETTLADRLVDRAAYAGALGDLANALRLTPTELARITLAVAGQTPTRARQLTADILRAVPAAVPTPIEPPIEPQRPVITNVINPESGPRVAGGSRHRP